MPAGGDDESDRERLRHALAESERLLAIVDELLQRCYAALAAMGVRPKEYSQVQRDRYRFRVRRFQGAP